MGWPGPDALAGPDAAALPDARAVEAAAGAGSLRHGEPASPARQAFAEAIPPGVTGAQWHQLQAELRGRPDGAAELRRLADYFAWSDGLHRLREARRAGAEADALRPLALAVDAGLPMRLRRGEVSAAEARQIKSATLELTLADPSERAIALQRWLAAEAASARPDPRQAEFDQRQAVVVAAWAAKPARDRTALERELESLRSQVFGAPPPASR